MNPIPSASEVLQCVQDQPSPSLILGRRLDYQADDLPCPLAQRPGSNLLCVGPDSNIRNGLLHAVVRSFAALTDASEVFYFRARVEEDRVDIATLCPPNIRCTTLAEEWTAEIEPISHKNALGLRLLLIDGLDYAKAFQSGGTTTPKSASPSSALRKWLEECPQQGCWTVAFADNWGRLASSCKDLLPSFQLRVGFCLNEDHAGALVSGAFEKLKGLDQPNRAVFVDQHKNSRALFRPFCMENAMERGSHE